MKHLVHLITVVIQAIFDAQIWGQNAQHSDYISAKVLQLACMVTVPIKTAFPQLSQVLNGVVHVHWDLFDRQFFGHLFITVTTAAAVIAVTHWTASMVAILEAIFIMVIDF